MIEKLIIQQLDKVQVSDGLILTTMGSLDFFRNRKKLENDKLRAERVAEHVRRVLHQSYFFLIFVFSFLDQTPETAISRFETK